VDEELQHTLVRVAEWYTRALDDHGPGAESVGWGSEDAHRLRFHKLAEVLDRDEPISVADLGCGYGALFDFLESLPSIALRRYVGYDLSPRMVAIARERITDPRARFVEAGHVDEEVDYSIVSGTFNVRFDVDERKWSDHARATLDELNVRSKRGFAFNMLSTYVDWKEDHLFYADPLEWFAFCKRKYSRFVSLLHDYPLYEWTMIVRRGE
jgi:SAM-dependent methyltransferase